MFFIFQKVEIPHCSIYIYIKSFKFIIKAQLKPNDVNFLCDFGRKKEKEKMGKKEKGKKIKEKEKGKKERNEN